jgi:cytochrome c553
MNASSLRRVAALMLLAFACLPGHGLAAAGDVAAGRQRAQPCLVCHGAQGQSQMPGVPHLAGNGDQFLQWQMVFFRSGRRQNTAMNALAEPLSDADIRNLGAYFASLPPAAASVLTAADPAKVARGRAITEQRHCAACHTDTFTGAAAAPRLARQRPEYLAKALTDYRSGTRPSIGLAAMTEAAAGLDDTDIESVTQFLATLP